MGNLTWKDVFNSQSIWPADYDECRDKAKGVGYGYIAFNGNVYSVTDAHMKNPMCIRYGVKMIWIYTGQTSV